MRPIKVLAFRLPFGERRPNLWTAALHPLQPFVMSALGQIVPIVHLLMRYTLPGQRCLGTAVASFRDVPELTLVGRLRGHSASTLERPLRPQSRLVSC